MHFNTKWLDDVMQNITSNSSYRSQQCTKCHNTFKLQSTSGKVCLKIKVLSWFLKDGIFACCLHSVQCSTISVQSLIFSVNSLTASLTLPVTVTSYQRWPKPAYFSGVFLNWASKVSSLGCICQAKIMIQFHSMLTLFSGWRHIEYNFDLTLTSNK